MVFFTQKIYLKRKTITTLCFVPCLMLNLMLNHSKDCLQVTLMQQTFWIWRTRLTKCVIFMITSAQNIENLMTTKQLDVVQRQFVGSLAMHLVQHGTWLVKSLCAIIWLRKKGTISLHTPFQSWESIFHILNARFQLVSFAEQRKSQYLSFGWWECLVHLLVCLQLLQLFCFVCKIGFYIIYKKYKKNTKRYLFKANRWKPMQLNIVLGFHNKNMWKNLIQSLFNWLKI